MTGAIRLNPLETDIYITTKNGSEEGKWTAAFHLGKNCATIPYEHLLDTVTVKSKPGTTEFADKSNLALFGETDSSSAFGPVPLEIGPCTGPGGGHHDCHSVVHNGYIPLAPPLP